MTTWQPGMLMTAARLNELPGRLVFKALRDNTLSLASTASGNPDGANAIPWETVQLDDLGGWVSSTPTVYTCRTAGWYRLEGGGGFAGSASGTIRTISWYQNGTLITGGQVRMPNANSAVPTLTAQSTPVPLAVGDTVAMVMGHDVGSALSTASGSNRPHITITYVHAA